MGQQDGKQMRVALLIAAAMLAIVLAVMEAMAAYGEEPAGQGESQASRSEAADIAFEPLSVHLGRVDAALRRNNVRAASRAWHGAYVTALDSRRWEGMLAVGDAALRIDDRALTRPTARAKARQAYLAALFRARDDRSREGLFQVAKAFVGLGDTALALHCVRTADSLAATDPGGFPTER